MNKGPAAHFSNRVEDCVKYGPGYPPALVRVLADEHWLTREPVVADVSTVPGD